MGPDLALGPLPKPKPGATVWVAFSGGLDSTVLLHRLHSLRLPLKAIHVNHQLQPSAGRWAEHCREFCGRLDLPIYVVDVSVDPRHPDGPEAAARAARYSAFRSLMKEGDWLAAAHHLDDQAETVLLRLLRGAGVTGLAAMRRTTPFPPGQLWRPLLPRSREELRRYAEAHGLHWIEDPHNLDPRFSRTFVRHELFPRLQQRWPQAIEMMARSAAHCADAVQLLDEVAREDLGRLSPDAALSVRRLLQLPPARRANAVRAWAVEAGHPTPSFEAMARLEKEVLRARPDSSPVLAWGETELRRFRDRLYLMQRLPPAPAPGTTLEWDGRKPLPLPPGCGSLQLPKPARDELALRVVFVKGGERLKPAGSRFTRTLRNLFQEEAIPPWVRERLPLIELNGELAGVADRWETASLKAARGRSGLKFAWERTLPGFGETQGDRTGSPP